MIYLNKLSSFDIKVDNVNHRLITGEDVLYDNVFDGTLDYVRQCMLNDELDVPVHLYRVYRNLHKPDEKCISPKNNYRYDLLLMPSNTTGVEYVKTHGHLSPQVPEKDLTYPSIIEVLYGSATVLLQRFSKEFDPVLRIGNEIDKIYLMKAPKGSKIIIPPNYAYTLINTRNIYLVTGRLKYIWEKPSERDIIEEKHGFAYYVIRKNARQEIVRNPNYKNPPRLSKIKPEEIAKVVKLRSKRSIVDLFREDPKRFEWLEKPWKVEWGFENS